MKQNFQKCISILLLGAMLFCLTACGEEKSKTETGKLTSQSGTAPTATATQEPDAQPLSVDPAVPQKVQFTMENGGVFVIETAPEFAPKTVENFLSLVESGFYDGLTFHRVIDGFMAQGGDPKGNGTGGSDKQIFGEFASNGYDQNTLSHTRGVVSMARSNAPNSASSQFFICYDDATFLDGSYAAFGKVTEGMKTVDGFLEVERTGPEGGTPTEPIVIKTAVIL